MSFNIQHCRNFITGEIDFDFFAQAIASTGADIIGLNEVRGKGADPEYEDQASILAEKLGFSSYFSEAIAFDGKNPYGNAVLSRYPIISAVTEGIPDPAVKTGKEYYETRALLKAKVDYAGGVNVLVTHFGLNTDEQLNAEKTVLANIPDNRCILMGDFNMKPDSSVISRISARLNDTAGVNDGPMPTFPSDKPDRKIDYIFVSEDIKVREAFIPDLIVSDHRPCIAVLDI